MCERLLSDALVLLYFSFLGLIFLKEVSQKKRDNSVLQHRTVEIKISNLMLSFPSGQN